MRLMEESPFIVKLDRSQSEVAKENVKQRRIKWLKEVRETVESCRRGLKLLREGP